MHLQHQEVSMADEPMEQYQEIVESDLGLYPVQQYVHVLIVK